MTNREFLNAVIEGTVTNEMKEYAAAEIEKLDATNAKRREETSEEFARRMGETYAGQMSAYRAAVSSLAGIPQERVRSVLLLSATSGMHECL